MHMATFQAQPSGILEADQGLRCFYQASRGVSVAVDDSSLGMGLMSFLASLVLVAAASCPAPAPGAGKEQGQMQMAVALATLAKEHLLPRTCTLLFLWRQPCDDSSA